MSKLRRFLFFIFFIVFFSVKVEALSVDKDKLTIKNGDSSSVNLYANLDDEIQVSSIEFTLVYTTYDVPANFKVASGYIDIGTGSAHKIVFDTPVSGVIKLGTINVKVVDNPKDKSGSANLFGKATTSTGDVIDLNSQTINITVEKNEIVSNDNNTTNKVTNIDNKNNDNNDEKENISNLLESIDSKIVDIKIIEDVFEYSIKIDNDVEELDLKPILKDDSYKVEVSNQKIAELKDNKITITISKNEFKEVYTIKVKVLEKIKIDDKKFVSSFNYKDKWIVMIVIFSVILIVGLLFVRKKR